MRATYDLTSSPQPTHSDPGDPTISERYERGRSYGASRVDDAKPALTPVRTRMQRFFIRIATLPLAALTWLMAPVFAMLFSAVEFTYARLCER